MILLETILTLLRAQIYWCSAACATLCTYDIGFPFTSSISTQTTGVHHIWPVSNSILTYVQRWQSSSMNQLSSFGNCLYAIQTGWSSNFLLCQVTRHVAASNLNCRRLSCSFFWIPTLSASLRYNNQICTITTSSRWMNSRKYHFLLLI